MLRPPFAEFPVLTTARLRLRALTAADVPQLLTISFFQGKAAQSLEEAQQMQALIWDEYAQGIGIHWGLALTNDESVVAGTAGFYRGFAGGVGEIGYVLLPAFRGQGYATEAVGALVGFGFSRLKLRQLTAFTTAANAPSQAVLRRAGFRQMSAGLPDDELLFVLDRLPLSFAARGPAL